MVSKQKLKFAIIGGAKTENTRDLLEEIKLRGHFPSTFSAKDIFFDSDAGVLSAKEKINSFDIFLLRAGHDEYQKEIRILARHLLASKKIVVDEILGKEYINGKMSQALLFSKNNIPHPKTFLASSLASYKKILQSMRLPIIIKPDIGKRGIGIKKFNSSKSALIFLKKNERGFILQEYLTADGDIRVFIVGNKVVGTMKRYIIKGDYRSNVSLGAKTEKIESNSLIDKIALKATKVVGFEIAGVDLIHHNRKYYVIEVNEGPQWQGFKKTTGVNPAQHIVEYAIKKYNAYQERLKKRKIP
jgi:ribosomal protein S6--L-glutamate ligase